MKSKFRMQVRLDTRLPADVDLVKKFIWPLGKLLSQQTTAYPRTYLEYEMEFDHHESDGEAIALSPAHGLYVDAGAPENINDIDLGGRCIRGLVRKPARKPSWKAAGGGKTKRTGLRKR